MLPRIRFAAFLVILNATFAYPTGGAEAIVQRRRKVADKAPAIRQVDVVRTGGHGLRHPPVLALERAGRVDDQLHPHLAQT